LVYFSPDKIVECQTTERDTGRDTETAGEVASEAGGRGDVSGYAATDGNVEREVTGMTHHLKTWPPYFQAVADKRKTFEVRKADRPFSEGDSLYLQEWNPGTEDYTGREIFALISYVLPGGAFGIEEGYCVLGLDVA
jgi:hypothetical protein